MKIHLCILMDNSLKIKLMPCVDHQMLLNNSIFEFFPYVLFTTSSKWALEICTVYLGCHLKLNTLGEFKYKTMQK